jgi:hypothetical protein
MQDGKFEALKEEGKKERMDKNPRANEEMALPKRRASIE